MSRYFVVLKGSVVRIVHLSVLLNKKYDTLGTDCHEESVLSTGG